jgi:hypothetical protein
MYTASSIRTALENITVGKGYCFENLERLKCPAVGAAHINSVQKKCCGDPKNCYDAHAKTCVQRVHICRNDNRRFKRILNFYFTVSEDNNDGFIDEKDIILKWLIYDIKLIDEKVLTRV